MYGNYFIYLIHFNSIIFDFNSKCPKSSLIYTISDNWKAEWVFMFHFLSHFYFIFYCFTILYWFCHTSTCIRHGYTCVPYPEPPSLLPPGTIPLGHLSAPAPSIQYHALNLDWWLVSYMIYMFRCHSPKSSHPLHLPQSKRLFYTSVSLLLSRIQGYRYHLSKLTPYSCLENPMDGGAW